MTKKMSDNLTLGIKTCIACHECQRLFEIDCVAVLSKTKSNEEIYICNECFNYKNLEAKEKQWI